MWRRRVGTPVCMAALLSSGSCAPARQPQNGPHDATRASGVAVVQPTPLVLAIDEGERRLRRFAFSAPQFTIKVDRRNGGSNDLVMGYEDLPPGGSIPPHWHRMADEIIFVHRGSGVVQLGDHRTAFEAGATIYIPRNVRVTIRNTGAGPLGIAFVFSEPGFEELLRDISTPEGGPLVPLSAAELTAIRKRHEWHTVYERP
jgi:quercetin dioxygenase-like cupin family protein